MVRLLMKVCILGVVMDSKLKFDSHIRELRKSCFYQLRRLKAIRQFIPSHHFATLIHSFITSRMISATPSISPSQTLPAIKFKLSKTAAQNASLAHGDSTLPPLHLSHSTGFLSKPELNLKFYFLRTRSIITLLIRHLISSINATFLNLAVSLEAAQKSSSHPITPLAWPQSVENPYHHHS